MPTLHHLGQYMQKSRQANRRLFTVALMIFFFIIFDGVLMYLAPIAMLRSGMSEGTIGLIIGLSSVAGLFFDILLGRFFEKTQYRSMFFMMLIAAAFYPIVLFGATTITMYLLAMAIWGLYYNLYNIGTLDFIGRTTLSEDHASSFGVLRVFDGLGYFIAPLVGSLVLLALGTTQKTSGWLLFLLIPAFLFYTIFAFSKVPEQRQRTKRRPKAYGILFEFRLWKEIGHILFPVLLFTFTINVVDSAIWTIGPIFSESLHLPGGFGGGLFMVAYTLPPLIVGWIVGRLTKRYGKKRTAITALLFGSLLLIMVGIITTPLLLVVVMFMASFCFSLAWPSMNAAYADYIEETPAYDKEIETVEDWFTNLGDTIGPITAGYTAQYIGHSNTFVFVGCVGFIMALFLLRFTPRSITVRIGKRVIGGAVSGPKKMSV